MLTIILLSINILVCLLLIGAVLLQKSEGGALGMGGGPSNFMSARGTGDLLTQSTWILFSIFLVISITLTLLAAANRGSDSIGKGLTIDPAAALQPKPSAAPAPLEAPAPDVSLPQAGGIPTAPTLSPGQPQTAPATPAPEKK
jgi:preprotein translocase subunit SecG